MITDSLLALSSAQAITADAVSTNTIDLSEAKDIGEGEELYLVFNVTTAGTGTGTIAFNAITSASADLSSGTIVGSAMGAVGTAGIVGTDLTLGKLIAVRVNPSIASLGQRYLGAQYEVTGTATVTVSCNVVMNIQDGLKFYPSAFTVA